MRYRKYFNKREKNLDYTKGLSLLKERLNNTKFLDNQNTTYPWMEDKTMIEKFSVSIFNATQLH